MAQQTIDIGTSANDGTGDPLRTAFDKANDNFDELYAQLGKSPLNAQTGTTYTFALTDAGKTVTLSNASAITATIPANADAAFPVGTIINVSQFGAGAATITADTGVTINGSSAGSEALDGQWAGATLYKYDTDAWAIWGKLA